MVQEILAFVKANSVTLSALGYAIVCEVLTHNPKAQSNSVLEFLASFFKKKGNVA